MADEVVKTLGDIIRYDNRYDIEKIMFYGMSLDGTLVIPETDLIQIYGRYLAPYILTYSVEQAYRDRYRYRPYALSRDVYGTPALGWLIMRMNDKECASKFYLKNRVRLVPVDVLSSIATKSSTRLGKNHVEYKRLIGTTVK